MRILELPSSDPQKIGSKKVHKNKQAQKDRQLNLFSVGRILQLHPESPFEEALRLDEQGDKRGAAELYHKAIQAGDRTADAYCNLGIMEAQEGQTVDSIDFLTSSLKHNPRHIEAHFNLGNIYVEAGNLDLGILHYELAIKIDPTFSSSYFNLGLTLAANKQYQKAIDVFFQFQQLCSMPQRKKAVEMIQKLRNMT